jgi:GGDEF domain-containing protein
MSIAMTEFARLRLFPADGRRTAIQGITAEAFTARLGGGESGVLVAGDEVADIPQWAEQFRASLAH